ncbi:MAG: UvrD-helicase domain-containing protein [Pseudoclavibacter sp.]
MITSGDAERLLHGLNPQQRQAVEYAGRAELIVAGAGSGKTRVLTHRIAWLIATGRAYPSQILAITFTNKAASEMRERVWSLLGQEARGMWVSTFHSACLRILRREASALGLNSSFTIYDTQDSRALIKRILKDARADMYGLTPSSTLHRISTLKNELRDPDDAGGDRDDPEQRVFVAAWREYEQRKRQANALDFDDLLGQTVYLLRAFPEIAARYRDVFRHILIDEYQDTNHAQYELVRLLADTSGDPAAALPGAGAGGGAGLRASSKIWRNSGSGAPESGQNPELGAANGDGTEDGGVRPARTLTVVGDSDQSIYAFRGADMRNITGFEHDFPDASVVLLEQNYRSTQNILTAANAVISQNIDRADKRLWTDSGAGPRLVGFTGYSAHDEAQFVADEIVRLHADEGMDYRDMAVFYRTNAQTRALEEIFVRTGLPYRVVGGTKFYERAEVKDVLAYLVAVVNPADELSVRRILNVPRRGIGQVTVERLSAWAASHAATLVDALDHGAEAGAGPKLVGKMGELSQALAAARAGLADGHRLDTVVAELLDASGYLPALQNSPDPQAAARAENVDELVSQVADFTAANPEASLADFLAEAALTAAADEFDDASGAVSLMTLHTAKGLEFDAVFVTGLEEGLLPHQMAIEEPGGMAEERRLFYVGITRARRRLSLSLSVVRTLFGQTRTQAPSRFLDDIPPEIIEWRRSPEEAAVGHAPRALGRGWDDAGAAADDDGWGASGHRGRSAGRIRPGRAGWASPVITKKRGAPAAGGAGSGGTVGGGTATASHQWANLITTAPKGNGDGPDLAVGDRVEHTSFGKGTVRSMRGAGRKRVALVDFDTAGRKQLVVAMAPLHKCDPDDGS